MSRNVTKEHLLEIFGQFGKIKNIELNWDNKTNLSRGTSTIEFHERAEAERAQIKMDGV